MKKLGRFKTGKLRFKWLFSFGSLLVVILVVLVLMVNNIREGYEHNFHLINQGLDTVTNHVNEIQRVQVSQLSVMKNTLQTLKAQLDHVAQANQVAQVKAIQTQSQTLLKQLLIRVEGLEHSMGLKLGGSQLKQGSGLGSKIQVASHYRIAGVQPYGVVILTPDNRYIIARVGRTIGKLGVVSSIASDLVSVGSYVIRP